MQRVNSKYSKLITLVVSMFLICTIGTAFCQSLESDEEKYAKYFLPRKDSDIKLEKLLNNVGLTTLEVGRSFALIAGGSFYPNLSVFDRELQPAAEDIHNLAKYLREIEQFDEIVVLENESFSLDNLYFFLQNYFPKHLKRFPKSRFLFTYSGHGFTENNKGYILTSAARSLKDKNRSIDMEVLRHLFDSVIESSHHLLVMLNGCYSGAFIRRSFGGRDTETDAAKWPGAHVIMSSNFNELSWHDPAIGPGSLFFESFFQGLNGSADVLPEGSDGIISIYELAIYLRRQVSEHTQGNQNTLFGDISQHGSRGGFFFLSRHGLTEKELIPNWSSANALLSKDLSELTFDLKNPDSRKRIYALAELAAGDFNPDSLLPSFVTALNDTDTNVSIKAMELLGQMGHPAKKAIPEIVKQLEHNQPHVRRICAEAIARLAAALQREKDIDYIEDLEKALEILTIHKKKNREEFRFEFGEVEASSIISQALTSQKAIKRAEIVNNIAIWLTQRPSLIIFSILTSFIFLLWLAIYLLRPIWLFYINHALKPFTEVMLPGWLGGITIHARYLLLIGFFQYRRRVLDAWVAKYIDVARAEFWKKKTVKERAIHISMPTLIDNNIVHQMSPVNLQSILSRGRGVVLIWGEGGVGKTSLACQIAKWAMAENKADRLCDHLVLPVFIEQEIVLDIDNPREALFETIRGYVQAIIKERLVLPQELVEALLRNGRILVIIDHFSEMSSRSRNAISPGHPDFPINSLIVTSRREEVLDEVPKTSIKPIKIRGDRLSSFMDSYLIQRNKRDLFTDREFFEGCSHLSSLVHDGDLTPLLIKIYAEQFAASKENGSALNLPDNIPELMFGYLNELNRITSNTEFDDQTIARAAMIIAWECLKTSYFPQSAKRNNVLNQLIEELLPEAEAIKCLKYFENKLQLLQIVEPERDRVRFILDPLAEYFAGLFLVARFGNNEKDWREFFSETNKIHKIPESLVNFLNVVRNCCVFRMKVEPLPSFVVPELEARINHLLMQTATSDSAGQ